MAAPALRAQDSAPAGEAHVATVSFLAARAAPTGGFWVALAGGVALAQVARRRSAREGYGTSLAAMLETVAIMGPARLSIPSTQAFTAPLLGRLEARGVGPVVQTLACAALRLLSNALSVAFFIWVIAGGLDAYAGTYTNLAGKLGFHLGETAAVALTVIGLVAWAAFASTIQVGVYRRGMASWPAPAEPPAPGAPDGDASAGSRRPPHRGRFDPRAVALAAVVAFALLIASTAWAVLGAVAAWLALAWAVARADRRAVPTGLAFAGALGLGALVFALGGGLGLDVALRRTTRAVLLVLVATWLRAAAGTAGVREVARRVLLRLRRVPACPEAARTLTRLGSEGRLLAAGRSLVEALTDVPRRPLPVLDAVLGWVVRESGRFSAPDGQPPLPVLRLRAPDALLVALAAAPLVPLAA